MPTLFGRPVIEVDTTENKVVIVKDWKCWKDDGMDWTNVPKKNGWYWVANTKYPENPAIVVRVFWNGDGELALASGYLVCEAPLEGDLWLGPLYVPEPPKGT